MRSPILDTLRGIAVILVLFRHYHFSRIMAEIGWIGVDLFFVLSGFLVSGLLFKEYKKTLAIKPLHFLVRRGFKIYPLFYTFLVITLLAYFALELIGRESDLDLKKMPFEALFLQNYFGGVWNHTWSLAVEEHFYILLSVIMFLLARSGKLSDMCTMVIGIISVISLVIAGRFLTWNLTTNYSFRTHFFATHLRIDSLLFGVLIAWFYHYSPQVFQSVGRSYGKYALILALGFLSVAFFWPIDSYQMGTVGLTMLYIGFGIILWLALVFEDEILKLNWLLVKIVKAFSFVGFYSYSIYLFHTMVAAFVMPIVFKASPIKLSGGFLFLFYFIFSIGVGVVMSKMIERPFLNLREKYFKSLT